MEKYNKFLRNITELIAKGLFTSKDLKKEVEDALKFKVEMDTFATLETFYSYRRSRLNNEKDYGRCISVILMT